MRRLDDLFVFTRIVEERSITGAARALHITPSAVSRRLSRLETDLQFRLFHRSTHHLSLTEGGRVFYEHCIKGIAEIDRGKSIAADASSGLTGALRVHATLGLGQSLVAPAIVDFINDNPTASVELEINDEPVNLLEKKFDVSIRGRNLLDEGLEGSSSLSSVNLLKVPYAICASPNYLERSQGLRAPVDLERHNCLVNVSQFRAHEWWFTDKRKDYKIKVGGNFVTNNGQAVYEAVLRGLGVARLPQYRIVKDVQDKRLLSFFGAITKSDRPVRAYYPRANSPPAKLRAFLSFLRKRLTS